MTIDLEQAEVMACQAVRRAARVCALVQQQLVQAKTLEKKDKSPVTVADFASQAVICALLSQGPIHLPVVGEEDAAELRQPAQAALLASVVGFVRLALGMQVSSDETLAWIDRGGAPATGSYWTLDPIDGTKGFLRGEQYALALGLIHEGQVVVGVLGCPNLPLSDEAGAAAGTLLVASRGRGARMLGLWGEEPIASGKPVRVSAIREPAQARFCESVESGHSDQDLSARIASDLGITKPGVRMDSQAKYAVVARGQAGIYLRLPTRADYQENIWDHAGGMIAVEEAGGKVTDIDGKALDFSRGRQLSGNRGIVATNGAIHAAVLAAVQRALARA